MRKAIAFLSFALLLLAVFDLCLGSVSLPIEAVVRVLCGRATEADSTTQVIVLNFRLPKLLTALLVGVALPTSGMLMQSLFQTPSQVLTSWGLAQVPRSGVPPYCSSVG